jgi:hypothetical protein
LHRPTNQPTQNNSTPFRFPLHCHHHRREVWAPLEDYMQVKGEGAGQTTYSPKFTAYLARLLINYDYASMSWWQRKTLSAGGPESAQRINRLLNQKGFDAMFQELDQDEDAFISREEFRAALTDPEVVQRKEQELLAQLQASVNFGLVRYQGREGVNRLVRLLRSEFGINRIGKRQIALLFALMDNLQPVEAIKQLIAETENASVVGFNVTYPGFGYDPGSPPKVTVSPGPGSNVSARAAVRLQPTGRILKIQLDEPVTGFPTNNGAPPTVEISAPGAEGGVRAVGIPKMNGDAVERIVLSNPGKGYTERDHVTIHFTAEGQPAPWLVRQAKPVLEMQVAAIEVEDGGYGYAHDLPISVEIGKPPFPVSAVATAKATALLTEPQELILRSWLPPANVSIPVTGLLPSNLAPKYDPCLERFIISPVEQLDPNYCIYFEDEFKVVPSQKFNKYFSFLDGPKARDPVEKERELDASVFWRFAVSGALCCSTAHAFLIPLDVVKTKMQADPVKYPTFVGASKRIYEEGGPRGLLLGAGATIMGYFVYGAVSFGLTEYFKRVFLEVAGPEYATFYPFAILLLASMSAAFFGAVAVTPFEALRIRSVTAAENKAATAAAALAAAAAMPAALAGEGGASGTCEVSVEEALAEAEAAAAAEAEAAAVAAAAAAAAAAATTASAAISSSSSSSSSSGAVGGSAAVDVTGAEAKAEKEEEEDDDVKANGMVAMVTHMAKEGSLGELFAGLGPAVVGEIPFMMAKFAVFDAVSKAIYALFPTASDTVALSLAVSLVSGMTAGVAAAVVSHPFDTLTTKVTQYSQQRRGGGIFAAVRDIYGQGGVGGFFKGTFPRAVKSAANIAIQFFLYDFSKVRSRVLGL